jgi:hypothetical protein
MRLGSFPPQYKGREAIAGIFQPNLSILGNQPRKEELMNGSSRFA